MRRVERYPVVWGAIVVVLLIALAGTFIAYLHSNTQASCINAVLRSRNDLTDADHINEARKIAGQKVAVTHESIGLKLALSSDMEDRRRGVLLYQQGVTEFKKSLSDWQARDNVINAARAAHPLGHC